MAAKKDASKTAKLAAALKDNLKRRKAQAQGAWGAHGAGQGIGDGASGGARRSAAEGSQCRPKDILA